MKKILSLIIVLSIGTTTLVSANDKVSPRLEKSLSQTFSGATYIKWQQIKGENIHQATFVYNAQRLSAFFNNDGKLIATGRAVTLSGVPLIVSRKLSADYSKFTATDIIEYVKDDETSYLVTMENEKTRLVLNMNIAGEASIFKKEKKN